MNAAPKPYIYESPDGGDTIYRRPIGSNSPDRELYRISERKKLLIEDIRHSKLWGEIHRAAKTDPALKEMLDKIEVYHQLKNTP